MPLVLVELTLDDDDYNWRCMKLQVPPLNGKKGVVEVKYYAKKMIMFYRCETYIMVPPTHRRIERFRTWVNEPWNL